MQSSILFEDPFSLNETAAAAEKGTYCPFLKTFPFVFPFLNEMSVNYILGESGL